MTYVGDTVDALALELSVVELLNGGAEISCSLEFNETKMPLR